MLVIQMLNPTTEKHLLGSSKSFCSLQNSLNPVSMLPHRYCCPINVAAVDPINVAVDP
jgi:hypothetical protein